MVTIFQVADPLSIFQNNNTFFGTIQKTDEK